MTDPGMQLVKVFSEHYEELLKLRTTHSFEEKLGRNMPERDYVDYSVIESSTVEALQEGVRGYLAQGWMTAGGICVTRIPVEDHKGYRDMNEMYAQAMVKPK